MGKTHFGGVRSGGNVVVVTVDHVTDEVDSVTAASFSADDHNTPALLVPADKVPIVFYHDHGNDNLLRWRKGTTIGSFAELDSEVTKNMGGACSYAQAYREPETDNLIVFARIASRYWSYTHSTDYGVTWGSPVQLFDFGSSQRGYLATVQRGSAIRCALYGHPTSSTVHEIYVCEIDLASGDVTVPGSGTAIANIYSLSGPLTMANLLLAYDPPDGSSIRLFDVSNRETNWEIAFGEWTNDSDTAYKYLFWDGAEFVKRDMVAAGVAFGYLPEVHYAGGMSFPNPTAGGVVFLAREESGTWYVEKWTTADGGANWSSELCAESSAKKLVRPFCPLNAVDVEVLYHIVHSYGTDSNGYKNYSADLAGWPV